MIGQLTENGYPYFIDILCRCFIRLPVNAFLVAKPFQCLQIKQTHRLPIIRPGKRIGNSFRKIHSIDGILPHCIGQGTLARTHEQFRTLLVHKPNDQYQDKNGNAYQYGHASEKIDYVMVESDIDNFDKL